MRRLYLSVALLNLVACSGSPDPILGVGGTTTTLPGTGGAVVGTGGTNPGSGGQTATGKGGNANGGAVGLGGSSNSGGSTSTTGGTTKGGSASTGGTSKGGSSSTGGVTTGGTTGKGGNSSTGSTTSTGGKSTGGTATGGNGNGGTSTGGTPGGGGTAGGVTYNCGLPAAGATGVAKPSGTPGNLTILNWAGFKGAVSYTFDDANSSQISNYAALQALGVRMTFYLQTNKTDAGNTVWAQAVKDGHELGNHSKSHTQTGTAADVDAATTFIQDKFGVKVWTMAAPYGDASYSSIAQSRFLINRGVSNAVIAPNDNTNPFNLPCFIPAQGAAASAFNAQIDSAQSAGGWRVVLVHGFTGGSDSAYQPVSLTEFTSSVNHAKSLGNMWIDTVANVGSYWRAQKVVSGVTATTSGSDKTWKWSLPSNFPTGKCLRVKVAGGTLKQNGNPVAWDGHGYYEISLDAGSVTLSP